jgi:hypothetical protein
VFKRFYSICPGVVTTVALNISAVILSDRLYQLKNALIGMLVCTPVLYADSSSLRCQFKRTTEACGTMTQFSMQDAFLYLAILGIPLAILGYAIWFISRWKRLSVGATNATRVRLALVGAVLGAISAALLVVLVPLWSVAVEHTRLQVAWVSAGVLMGLAAAVCGILGAARLRRPATSSLLLFPVWAAVAGLLLKATLD